MFPGYVGTVDEAVVYLVDWARLVGGWQLDGLDLRDQPGGGLRVEQFRVELTGGFVLTVSMTLRADLEPTLYRFNLGSGAALVWRHDMHPGHEVAHGGPTHLHIGPAQDNRVSHGRATLADVADLVHRTLRGEFPEEPRRPHDGAASTG